MTSMKIRSITCFLDPGRPVEEAPFRAARDLIAQAQPAFTAAGYEVETVRLATVPFPRLVVRMDAQSLVDLSQAMEQRAQQAGFDYISLGPALPDIPESYTMIPAGLAATQNVFFGGTMTLAAGGISPVAVRACAEVIQEAAMITPDGFTNLRFAALANVPAGSPFFPAAYAGADLPAFAIATEAAGLAVEAFSTAKSLSEAQRNLVVQVEEHAQRLVSVAAEITRQTGARFGGIDFSLAPFPEESLSLGTAFERLGVPATGLHGSLAAAALIADCLSQAQFPHAGFSGMMLPVLEDATLANRAADGSLSIKDLLLYSAVCGTGLDTIPLPGDTSVDALYAVLLDLAALSQRLDKPLTARLMPIPGKRQGDPTNFNFSYFANSRVMGLSAQPLQGFLATSEDFYLHPRKKN